MGELPRGAGPGEEEEEKKWYLWGVMNRILHLVLIVLLAPVTWMYIPSKALAQQPGFVTSKPEITPIEQTERNILSDLATPKAGQGVIRIFQSPALKAIVRVRKASDSKLLSDNALYTTMPGYKVQIYSGNTRDSRSVAATREAQVKQLYPDLESVTLYNAPFWKVQVGNFVNREEANEVLKNIKKQFPAFGKQSFIVRTTIKVPL